MNKSFFLRLFLSLVFSTLIFPQVKTQNYLEGAVVTAICSQGKDLWVSTYGHGIFFYSAAANEWTNFSTKNGNLENDLFYNIAASKDFVWAGSGQGLFTYDKKKKQWRKRVFALGGEMGNWIRSLLYDPAQNILWVGRFKNLTSYEVAKNRFVDYDMTQNEDAKTNTFISIKADGDSVIWFGTESGIHKYNKKKKIEDKTAWQFINNKKNNFNNEGNAVSISDLLFEGKNIWFGLDEFVTDQLPEFNIGGVYKFNRQLDWKRISSKQGMSANGIYCLARTGNKIWASVYSFDKKEKKKFGKGLVFIDRKSGEVTNVDLNELDIKSATILSMLFDGTDMWLGTDGGLYRINVENPFAQWTLKKRK